MDVLAARRKSKGLCTPTDGDIILRLTAGPSSGEVEVSEEVSEAILNVFNDVGEKADGSFQVYLRGE